MLCWYGYPVIRGKLSPLVIQEEIEKILISGLMNKAILEENEDLIKRINKCMEFLKEDND